MEKNQTETGNFDLFGAPIVKDVLLRDKFLEPPFSILDGRGGEWQRRKQEWKRLGIESEKGREAECMPGNFGGELNGEGLDKYGRKPMTGTSVFDPALCELMYNWFCPPNGKILDPFAGGSVRGIVANYLGFKYTGIELRGEQVASNYEQAKTIVPHNIPEWITGDSERVLLDMQMAFSTQTGDYYDFLFTCPPYHDLEVYSDDPNDLSNMPYDKFLEKYSSIITKAVGMMRADSFAVIVVGDIRDSEGFYKNFNSHTKDAFIKAGARLYNEAKLLQPLGTAMLRANNIFGSYKKLIKVHEDVLVFYKGNPKKIKEKFNL
jgi:hypothetical protein